MVIIPGRQAATCEGLSRREWLRVGGLAGLGGVGLGLPGLLAAREQGPPAGSFGRAKACIVLFLFGAPAHQDTWDLKPAGPSEERGEFRPIATRVPGIQICEHLPQLAAVADRYTIVRSVTHPDNTHTVAMHYMLTGMRHQRPRTNPQNAPDDYPCFGAVVQHERSRQATSLAVPPAISLNAPANQVSANNHIFPGFFAGFLGARYNPLMISQSADADSFAPLPAVDSIARIRQRQQLVRGLEQPSGRARSLAVAAARQGVSAYRQQAYDLLTSARARDAFRVDREAETVRSRYGMTPFGQGCLLARRLVEAGVALVTVNWQRDDAYWDTHSDNFTKHKDPLLPNLDRGFSALLRDLEQRGLLDETLVVCLSEFGRTPTINKNAGRDHWAACNSVVLAGAGVAGGHVYGASDHRAAYPQTDPVGPEDLAATIYHLLGVPPQTTLQRSDGRPVPLPLGNPLWDVI